MEGLPQHDAILMLLVHKSQGPGQSVSFMLPGWFEKIRSTGSKKPEILQGGAPKIAKLPYKWLYGRYNYS